MNNFIGAMLTVLDMQSNQVGWLTKKPNLMVTQEWGFQAPNS
jgi:hypothetical protein